ncbi:hypothetical protein C0995_014012 [Termitomyces sp. Mi166|nr:hypothetical protein C0995_014012 [Termitomyces sp. Mi166\
MASNLGSDSKTASIEMPSGIKLPILMPGDLTPELAYEFAHACHAFFHAKDIEAKDQVKKVTCQPCIKLPILMPSDLIPELAYKFAHACHAFFHVKDIKAKDQVKKVTVCFRDICIMDYIDSNLEDLEKLLFTKFMADICKHYTKEDWEWDLQRKLLGSKQNSQKTWTPKKKDEKETGTTSSLALTNANALTLALKAKPVAAFLAWNEDKDLVAAILPCQSLLRSAIIEEASAKNRLTR